MLEYYQSQYQQDRILNELYFKNKNSGVFVDIGAHDGKTFSNTYFYEKYLNWTGMCIEPLPKPYKELTNNRNCILVEGCAWNENTTKKFRMIDGYSEMLSGIIDSYPRNHIDRIETELNSVSQISEDIDVICYDINELLINNSLTNIDLLSIDIEGGELTVLSSIDFSKININVILAENNYEDIDIRKFLISNGYEFSGKISIDDVYVNKKFKF
jgi:FkbM family methyltransferase